MATQRSPGAMPPGPGSTIAWGPLAAALGRQRQGGDRDGDVTKSCGSHTGYTCRRPRVGGYASRSASPRAFMCASASIVTIGFTPVAVGKAEPSQT